MGSLHPPAVSVCRAQQFPSSPDEVAAEDEAEHKDEDASAENDHVDVQRQVLEGDRRHCARFIGINQPQTAEASFRGERETAFTIKKGMRKRRGRQRKLTLYCSMHKGNI